MPLIKIFFKNIGFFKNGIFDYYCMHADNNKQA